MHIANDECVAAAFGGHSLRVGLLAADNQLPQLFVRLQLERGAAEWQNRRRAARECRHDCERPPQVAVARGGGGSHARLHAGGAVHSVSVELDLSHARGCLPEARLGVIKQRLCRPLPWLRRLGQLAVARGTGDGTAAITGAGQRARLPVGVLQQRRRADASRERSQRENLRAQLGTTNVLERSRQPLQEARACLSVGAGPQIDALEDDVQRPTAIGLSRDGRLVGRVPASAIGTDRFRRRGCATRVCV